MLDLGAGSGAVPVPCIAGRPHGLVRTCYRAGENSARTSEIRGFGKRHKNPVRGPYRRETWLDTGGAVRPAAHRDLLVDRGAGARADHRAHQGGARAARRQGIRLGRPPRRLDVPLARARKKEGASLRTIAKRLKVPTTTLHRAMQPSERGAGDGVRA
jgi:hypothetical protein